MKAKKLVILCLYLAIASTNNLSAQTWNLNGNTGIGTSGYLGTSDANDLRIKTANVLRMVVKTSGRVGIGVPNPSAKLHVFANGEAVRVAGLNSYIQLVDNTNALKSFIGNNNNDLQIGLSSVNTSGKLQLNTATGTQIEVSANGFTNFKAGYLTIGNVNPAIIKQNGNDLNLLPYSPGAGTPGNLILNTASGLFRAGNVGIGTSTPSRAKLVVEGNVGKTVAIFGQNSTGISLVQNSPSIGFNSYFDGSSWRSLAAGYAAKIFMDPGNGVIYFGGTVASATGTDQTYTETTPMGITPDGRVIINSTNYTSTLAVKRVASASDAASFQGTTLYSHFAYGTNEDTYIRGGKATSNIIIADLCNNVGVGTANPAYKLDVCGTMRAKEVRVATGWCDYVFADDYQLPALSDVEDFIKTNKHLPDITPGAVIESEGLEVGKTSAQMIKKIEELTLYVIDLQKQVDALKAINSKHK